MILFRYRDFDFNDKNCMDRREKEIVDNQPYFQRAEKLNDPFECRPWLSIGVSKVQKEASVRCLSSVAERSERIQSAKALGKFRSGPNETLRKFEAIGDAVLSNLYRSSLMKRGICCFSEDPASLLMWSHYAQSHAGICLIYRFDQPLIDAKHLGKVQYADEYPEIRLYEFNAEDPDESHGKWGKLGLLRKASPWHYEQEWRFFGKHVGPMEFDKDPRTSKSLVGVIRGAAMSDDAKSVLRKLASKRKAFVTLDATLNHRSFKIDIRGLPKT